MSSEKKDKDFIKKPVYPGGIAQMKAFIKNNLSYPEQALNNRTEGTVLVKYDIDHTGKVTDARVIKGIGDGCDEEAMRVVKLLKFRVPKNPRNLKVLFHKDARISFRLPPQKSMPSESEMAYKITPASGTSQKGKSSSYSYTIKW